MANEHEPKTIGRIPDVSTESTPLVAALSTRVVWAAWLVSVAVLVWTVRSDWTGVVVGPFAIDGLTVLLWTVVTFFSGVVHSYGRRYMAGTKGMTRFYTRIFAFTLFVAVLAAADHLALFVLAWLSMGLVMADLVGHVRGWPQARSAASHARKYFVASTLSLAVGVGVLWNATGAATVSGILPQVDQLSTVTALVAGGALLLAAAIQSALVPFHGWLMSSMTAPTPASALMHAGFVNAGGVLLTRFAPVMTAELELMLVVTVVGGLSALVGKLMKSVQPAVKNKLGCSTTGQMGFMIMQAGLGFFGAALTHLILHGFYKAYLFLSSGEAVEHRSPEEKPTTGVGLRGGAVTAVVGIAGGALFGVLTGEGTHLGSGLLLPLFVVLTTLHATRTVLTSESLPATLRYVGFPAVFLAAIGLYAGVYSAVSAALVGVPTAAPAELTAVHGLIAVAFVAAYVAVDRGWHRSSKRLYVMLLNHSQPTPDTVLTNTEDYYEY
ncbi:proton-conducting transporter membrane subunit [Haloarculaceae archaeon H-GB2-1]|nr:proton-conducting transporter membrane subunit [Haloarculaceae archaeon H-GB1-1]MEA5387390.1 proton-conducting transporter membrane subunit [Haloarculaceae archaeon H-GB11]MEA5408864.1 proton-conducting transporter membrane subunit [Haloarculaceae archaeon H-GB2-1]